MLLKPLKIVKGHTNLYLPIQSLNKVIIEHKQISIETMLEICIVEVMILEEGRYRVMRGGIDPVEVVGEEALVPQLLDLPMHQFLVIHMHLYMTMRYLEMVEEIVELLNNEKIADLAVIKIPAERKYADHMVIGTANSDRHLRTVSSLIVSVFKRKMWLSDPVPRVEGAQDKQCGWNALDLGNIVVHLLTQEQREYYDLETLWSVGAEYDDNSRQYDNISSTGHLSTLEELMKTDFDLSLLDHDNSDVKESSN